MTKIQGPQKSLRTLLMLWFLLFSVVPLAFITGYSVVKYEQAIDMEQLQRLGGNFREISTILGELESELTSKVVSHAKNNSLIYYLSQRKIPQAREVAKSWLLNNVAHRLSLFAADGLQVIALYKDSKGEAQVQKGPEKGDMYLSPEFLKKISSQDIYKQIEIRRGISLDLIVVSKIYNSNERLVGFIEEIIELDKAFLDGLKKRMNLEVAFFPSYKVGDAEEKKSAIVSSIDDLELYKTQFFLDKKEQSRHDFFELIVREVPFGFVVRPLHWGEQEFYMLLGTSKGAVKSVLKNVNYAFFMVVGGIIFVLILLSIFISRLLLRPVSNLLEAIQGVRPGEPIPEVETGSDNELGMLAKNFNELSKNVNRAQSQLKEKISELEFANQEIRETQAKLVHSAKMASLGQLVAGVAHELNNPIGFIYSNMGHLRDYSKALIKLIGIAEKEPKALEKNKKDLEFDYIVEDMPKLIKSCEEGARRTRDIVLGLRNFSRLEEAKLQEIDLEDSLDTTLNLLSGELKNRVEVVKEYGKIPRVSCFPSQLNQVFMNILSNAAQSIDEKGKITVATRVLDEKNVEVSIRDTGKGMNVETAEKVFDPFFTTKTLGGGTGLGLSISYGIVEKHGGEIIVESKLGQGTAFKIHLPISGPETKGQ